MAEEIKRQNRYMNVFMKHNLSIKACKLTVTRVTLTLPVSMLEVLNGAIKILLYNTFLFICSWKHNKRSADNLVRNIS